MWPTMRDEHRLIAAIEALTHQVARVAWAIEVQVIDADPEDVVGAEGVVPSTEVAKTAMPHATISAYATDPCTCCGSQLVPDNWPACPACLEPKKEVGDG